MAYNPKDYYFKKAKNENYAARSIYKLEEIDNRFKILKSGFKILDLGAAPGSWSQYSSRVIGPKGRILGIDLQPVMLTLPNAIFIVDDILKADLEKILHAHDFKPPFDIVLSDMAPKTTGIRITDQARSMELCEMALSVAERYLRNNGSFVCKLFHSGEFETFRNHLKERFQRVELLKPKSTRSESKEIFFIGLQFQTQRRHAPE